MDHGSLDGNAASDRSNYDCSDDGLSEVAGKIPQVAKKVQRKTGFFNSAYEDLSQRNPTGLMSVMGAATRFNDNEIDGSVGSILTRVSGALHLALPSETTTHEM